MAQSNAAKPILDYARGMYNRLESITGDPSKKRGETARQAPPVVDTRTERANDSFRKAAADRAAAAAKRATPTRKPAARTSGRSR